MATTLPTFDELPHFQDLPGCAWGVFGKDDQLGTVNLLTPELVKKAAKEEIRTGKSISLNWPLNFPLEPLYLRKPLEHTIYSRPGSSSRDDEIRMNTQTSSQWDGLRHYGLGQLRLLYNNMSVDNIKMGVQEPITPDTLVSNAESIKLGVHNLANHGITGRGVLLDVAHYCSAENKDLSYDPWTPHGFDVALLQEVAGKEGVEFRKGDILIIRTGFIKKFYESSVEEKTVLVDRERGHQYAGIQQSGDMRRFLWNTHFAAVASDCPSVEQSPGVPGERGLHETILGLWGMPMGEMFDLEALSKECAAQGRWTFFFTSWPLNILGGCASPPNAAAIF